MKYRVKATCPTCGKDGKSALWDSRSPGRAKLYNHRVQEQLDVGEKPVRCKGSQALVDIAPLQPVRQPVSA